MDLPWLHGKVYQNQSISSGRRRWASQGIGWVGADPEKKTKSRAHAKSQIKTSCQTAASKQRTKQVDMQVDKKGQSVRLEAWWRESNIKIRVRRVRLVLGSPRLPRGRRGKRSFEEDDLNLAQLVRARDCQSRGRRFDSSKNSKN